MVNMLSVLIMIFLLIPSLETYGQDADKTYKAYQAVLTDNIGWSEGSILLNDGTELKGLLKYNDKNGLLSFEKGSDSRSFTSRNVAGFEFHDEQTNKQRVFYTFPYDDSQNNVKRPLFFEVIKEFKLFAVVAKSDPVDIEQKSVSTPGVYNNSTGTFSAGTHVGSWIEISQTETIYIMDTNGNITPYLKTVSKEIDGVLDDRSKSKNKLLNKDLLEDYIGKEMYEKLVSYANENSLEFQTKADLIKILDYYSEISK